MAIIYKAIPKATYTVVLPTRYTNHMTTVAAITTKEGMVVIVDGKAVDAETKEPVSDDEIKIFEISPHCVMLFAGYTSNGFHGHMDMLASFLTQAGINHVSAVAQMFSKSFEGNTSGMATRTDWPMEYIVAGYDTDRSSHIYRIGKPDWDIKPFKMPYGQAGIGWETVLEYFKQNYRDDMTLSEGNILAVDAMKVSCDAFPESVGGKIRLWNIVPPAKITKFRPAGIRKLAKQVK